MTLQVAIARAENGDIDAMVSVADYIVWEEDAKSEIDPELGKKVLEKLVTSAEFSAISEEDITQVIDLEYAPLNARFGLDKLTPEEWANDLGRAELKAYYEQIYPEVAIIFGTTGKESFYEVRREPAINTVKDCLVLNEILGTFVDPTKEEKAEKKLMEMFTELIFDKIYGGK